MTEIKKQLDAMGYDYAVAIATKAEIELPFTDIYVAEWGIYHYSYKWIIFNPIITAFDKHKTIYNYVANTSNLSHFNLFQFNWFILPF